MSRRQLYHLPSCLPPGHGRSRVCIDIVTIRVHDGGYPSADIADQRLAPVRICLWGKKLIEMGTECVHPCAGRVQLVGRADVGVWRGTEMTLHRVFSRGISIFA